jgi:hypothetical protein
MSQAWVNVLTPAIPTIISSTSSFDVADASHWIDRENDLKEIGRYSDNWDGFGSPAPDRRIVDLAIAFIGDLRYRDCRNPPLRVALSPNGSVCVEWQSRGNYIEAEIVSTSRVEWMQSIRGKNPTHWTESLSTGVRSDVWNQTSQIALGAAASVLGR